MPTPVKPCEGRFSEEVLEALSKNRDRSQWANHTCEVCGLAVGATIEKGRWVPEQHWPSVKYPARNGSEKKPVPDSSILSSEEPVLASDEPVLAESASR